MAWDAAFSFCYADLPALWQELGAQVAVFSPLRDSAPPPYCAGLYFPGGYPELHAAALAANTSFRTALTRLADAGLPSTANAAATFISCAPCASPARTTP